MAADPLPFFVINLDGHNSNPIIPYEFYSSHLQGKNEFMKLKLTSDDSDKTWEVKLNCRRFAGGWEDFSAAHCFQDNDVLTFRHDGDEFFHVTRSSSETQIHSLSSTSSDDEEEDSDWKNISSSSVDSCLLTVTPSNLRLNRVTLAKKFTRRNGLDERWCGIDLMNQSGKSWGLSLRYNTKTCQNFIRGWRNFCTANKLKTGSSYRFKVVRNGTRPLLRLCSDIITPQGKCSKANGKGKVSAKSRIVCESASVKHNRFMTVTVKPYMVKSRQLRIKKSFAKANGITKAGEIILVDKNGLMWSSSVVFVKELGNFYMAKNCMSFCVANGVKMGETFTLEYVREEGTTPMFTFCSKAKRGQAQSDGTQRTVQASLDEEEGTKTRFQKRARDSAEAETSRGIGPSSKPIPVNRKRGHAQFDGKLKTVKISHDDDEEEEMEKHLQKRPRVSAESGTSRRVGKSSKSTHHPKNLQRKRPQQPCSIIDQLTKVKESIVDTLKWCKTVRSELKMKEQSLKASLQEIDALGKNVLEISKTFK